MVTGVLDQIQTGNALNTDCSLNETYHPIIFTEQTLWTNSKLEVAFCSAFSVQAVNLQPEIWLFCSANVLF
jgi:hypothetical protein